MVIRGKTRGGGEQLANYLMDKSMNEQAYVFNITGTSNPNNLRLSLLEMSFSSELTKSNKGLYHAQINPAYGEDKLMTQNDWLKAVDILETELQLKGQKRVIVMHEKSKRLHAHVVWERYNHANGKMISDSFSRLAQDRARKTMEIELSQQRTPDRNGRKRIIRETLTRLWNETTDGKTFILMAAEKKYLITAGTQRPYMLVDDTGRSFDLVRLLDKVKSSEVRDRLKGVRLDSEKKIIETIRDKQNQKEIFKNLMKKNREQYRKR